uniref:Microseminoprotein beta n=1 Tax=Catagonus wagneri TaxID=51154 RepID=A0A8C3YV61_9CETA
MKSLLGTLVVLATFVTLCNSQCYLIPNKNVALNVLPYLWIMTQISARKSSTRRPVPLQWWKRRTQERPVLSLDGY